MWPTSHSGLGISVQPQPARDFARDNARYIKSLTEKRRAREANEAGERAAKARGKSAGAGARGRIKPLKAFSEVQPKVTAYMTGELTVKPDDEEKLAAGRLYLQGHTKTGPFLERGNKPGDYYNSSLTKSQSSDAMERLEMPPMTSSVVGLTARFSEITARDRRARISDLVTQICETPPLIEGRMVLNTGTGRRTPSLRRTMRSSAMDLRSAMKSATGMRSSASTRHTSSEEREAEVKANGVQPTMMTKSVSMSVLNKVQSKVIGSPLKSAKAPSTSAALASEDLNKATPTPASPAKSVHDELGLDEATKRELRLDLGGIEGSIDAEEDENKADENGGEDENEREALTNDSDGLPVVKGVCVDYVHANRDGASVFGRQKWMETGRSKSSKSASDSQSVAATPSHKAGSVPQYLLNRQEKWRQAEERRAKNKPDPRCPKGHVRLTEEERVGIVGAMQERRQKLIDETNRMSVRSDTMRSQRRMRDIEEELQRLEGEMVKYGKKVVYVPKELLTVGQS